MSDKPIISPVFDQPGSRFVFTPPGTKFPPIEKEWQNKGHTFQQARAYKGNVGILACNGFIGLDKDYLNGFAGLELPKTTRWETRPGREGLWFRCRDNTSEVLAKYGLKEDQAQIKLFKGGQPAGEVKLRYSYQMIPPSWKIVDRHRVDYKMLDDVLPAEISLDQLLSELLKIGITFSKKPKPTKQKPIATKQVQAHKDKGRRYAEAALKNEVNILSSTPEGNRNDQLNKSAFALGQLVSSGALDKGEVIQMLSTASNYAGLDRDEIEKTIKSGLEAGAQYPREIQDKHCISGEELASALKIVKGLSEKLKNDPAAPYKPKMFEAIRLIRSNDPEEWARLRKVLKDAGELREFERFAKKEEGPKEKEQGALRKINECIPDWIEQHHFKTAEDTDKIFHYEHGVYLDDGETVLKRIIEEEFADITTENVVRDAIGKVKRRTYVDRVEFNKKHILNVKSGLLDLETLELEPHTPDYLSTGQLDVIYDPNSKCPSIMKFLKEVAQPHDIALIGEILGWLLWPDYSIHKAVMLLGPGRNGKGTLLRLITALLGKRNVSNVTLQDLVSDKFSKADLFGKMANIGGDLPSRDLSDTASFRNLTGGDDNRAQEKYRPAFSFRNKAKLLFSANVLPKSPDDTYAFYSRWILIEFLKIFDVEKGTADPDLDAKLSTPEELSGLLNLALTGLKRLREKTWRFSYNKTVENVEIMYKRNANPVLSFLMDECEADPGSHIEKTYLQQQYNEYAKKHNIKPLSTTSFTKLLKDQSEIPISDFRPWSDDRSEPRAWLGVKFKVKIAQSKLPVESEELAKSSRPSPSSYGASQVVGDEGLTSTPSRVLTNPSLTKEERKEERGKNRDVSKIGYPRTLDGVDGVQVTTVGPGIEAAIQRADEIMNEWEEHFKTPTKQQGATCPVCGEDIGLGHSSRTFEGLNYCTTCPTHFEMLSVSVKALTEKNNGLGPTTTEIYEDVAVRGDRPPKKELLPGLLRATGCKEKDGRWVLPPTGNESQTHNDNQTTTNETSKNGRSRANGGDGEALLQETVERFETDGKNIVPLAIAQILGCEKNYIWVVARLRKMGFEQTKDIDPTSQMPIFRRRTILSDMDHVIVKNENEKAVSIS